MGADHRRRKRVSDFGRSVQQKDAKTMTTDACSASVRYCTLYYIGYFDADHSIITGQPDCAEVFDEDGRAYPDLAAAVREHARQLVETTAMPGLWSSRSMRHETWQGTEATAFDAAYTT